MYKQKIITAINFINLACALFLVPLAIFHYTKIQNITLYVLFISYGIEFFGEERWKSIKLDKVKWVFGSLLFFYLLTFIYFPFEETTKHFYKILEYRLPFLAFGFIGFFGLNKHYKFVYFAYAFVLTSILSIFYLIFYHIGFVEFVSNPNRNNLLSTARIEYINCHMIFNYYLNVSLMMCYYLWTRYKGKKHSIYAQFIVILMMAIMYYVLLLSEGRQGFITANIVIFIIIFHGLWHWRKKIAVVISSVVLIGMMILIANHPKIKGEERLEKDIRVLIWENAIQVIKERPILGYGASTAAETFINKCTNNPEIIAANDATFLQAVKERRTLAAHAHSQFLQSTMEYGIFGFITLLLINILPIIVAPKRMRIFIALFMIITAGQLITDIYISGVPLLIFTLLLTVFFYSKDKFSTDSNEKKQ